MDSVKKEYTFNNFLHFPLLEFSLIFSKSDRGDIDYRDSALQQRLLFCQSHLAGLCLISVKFVMGSRVHSCSHSSFGNLQLHHYLFLQYSSLTCNGHHQWANLWIPIFRPNMAGCHHLHSISQLYRSLRQIIPANLGSK